MFNSMSRTVCETENIYKTTSSYLNKNVEKIQAVLFIQDEV